MDILWRLEQICTSVPIIWQSELLEFNPFLISFEIHMEIEVFCRIVSYTGGFAEAEFPYI